MLSDPIVACATPRGEGAVAVVRLSGEGVVAIADRCFRVSGKELAKPLMAAAPRTMVFGMFLSADDIVIDRGLAVYFPAPRSFTGEDVVEFHVHGNPLIVEQVIDRCTALGCRIADPGEFSRRAFVNGKMDLTQAEALASVIRAESDAALRIAQSQLAGELRTRFEHFRQAVIDALALLELELDFVQEGYELVDQASIDGILRELGELVESLLDSYRGGERLRRGPRLLLLGRPNAGKSSLFNAFIGQSRAIVSDMPGTTRDWLEERIVYNGVVLHLLDTAGLRETEDAIEAEGVLRAQNLILRSDHVFYLIDSTLSPDVLALEKTVVSGLAEIYPDVRFDIVFTKEDLVTPAEDGLSCSVHDRAAIVRLLDIVTEDYRKPVSERLVLISERQRVLLMRMREILLEIREGVGFMETELLSTELRALLKPLSEVTGAVTNDDVLDSVFSSFCIGK